MSFVKISAALILYINSSLYLIGYNSLRLDYFKIAFIIIIIIYFVKKFFA